MSTLEQTFDPSLDVFKIKEDDDDDGAGFSFLSAKWQHSRANKLLLHTDWLVIVCSTLTVYSKVTYIEGSTV